MEPTTKPLTPDSTVRELCSQMDAGQLLEFCYLCQRLAKNLRVVEEHAQANIYEAAAQIGTLEGIRRAIANDEPLALWKELLDDEAGTVVVQ